MPKINRVYRSSDRAVRRRSEPPIRRSERTSARNFEALESRQLLTVAGAGWEVHDDGIGTQLFAELTLPSAGSGATVLTADLDQLESSAPSITVGEPPVPLVPALGTSFDTVNMVTNAANNGGALSIPPDPIGAAGPNHVVNVVNYSIEWHTKAGVTQNSQSLQSFFTAVGAVNRTFDPKVIYDQEEGRFVVVTLERRDIANGDATNSSRILVAVSDDDDPNGTWYYQAIDSKINIGGVDRWADYPGLAVDEDAVYITNNMFGFGGGPYGGVRLWILHKEAGSGGWYDGGAATLSVHDPVAEDVTFTALATTTQPAHVFGAPAGFGTFLVQHSGLTNGFSEFVAVIRIDDPLGLGAGPTFANQFVNVGNIDNVAGDLPDAPQLGSATAVEVNDRRALNAVWRDDSLYVAATILPNAGADSGQTTAHWFQIDTSILALLSLTDQGNVGGEDIAAGTYTFFPSIAVDGSDNVAIGFAASAPSIYPGAYYTGREATDLAGTVQPSGVLRAGLDYYVRTFGGPRNRWGDYSGISVDPADDATFWVFNEYAMSRGTPTGLEDGRWATAFGSFTFAASTSTVAGRHLFYNRSAFDGNNASINTSDDAAVAPDKTAYLPGDGLAVFDNVSSYSRGINGIIIDLVGGGAHGSIALSTLVSDFVFKVGNNNTPSSWAAAPTPNAVSVRTNFDGSGTDRVEITWADGAISNQWLEVQMLPTSRTGLTATDVFFWGNKIGDIGSPTPTSFVTTAATDATPIISGGLGPAGGITNPRDIDRSNVITAAGDRSPALANIGAITRINIGTGGPFAPEDAVLVTLPGDSGIASALAGALSSNASSTSPLLAPSPPATERLPTALSVRLDSQVLDQARVAVYFQSQASRAGSDVSDEAFTGHQDAIDAVLATLDEDL